jgi:hypothetical protein
LGTPLGYANSTLAWNADTGQLAWHYNHAPGESLDLDEVFERVLVDDQGQNYVFTAGNPGLLWKVDRKTGTYLGHKEMVFQNVYDSFDPATAEPHHRNDIVEQRFGEWVSGCPSTEGGKGDRCAFSRNGQCAVRVGAARSKIAGQRLGVRRRPEIPLLEPRRGEL